MAKKKKSGIDQQLLIKIGIGVLLAGGAYYGLNSIGDAPPPGPVVGANTGSGDPVSAVSPVNRPVAPVGGGSVPIRETAPATPTPKARMLVAADASEDNDSENRDDTLGNGGSPSPLSRMPAGEERPGQPVNVTQMLEKIIGPQGLAIAGKFFNAPAAVVPSQQAVARIVVQKDSGTTEATAFLVGQEGTLVTNYHTIANAQHIELKYADGQTGVIAGIKHVEPMLDLAVLQVVVPEGGMPLPILSLSDTLPEQGQTLKVLSAAQASGEPAQKDGSVLAVYSAAEMQEQTGLNVRGNWLWVSIPITGGQNGSPLVNPQGQVVGMNTLQLALGQNQNIAVSAIDLQQILQSAGSQVAQPVEGFVWQDLEVPLLRQLAKNLEGTDQGNALLAKVNQIAIVVAYSNGGIDPTGKSCETVYLHAEQAFKKADVKVTYGEVGSEEKRPVLIVRLTTKPSRDPSADARMLAMDASLLCPDPQDPSGKQYVKIWSQKETDLGNVSLTTLSTGQLSRSVWTDLTSFFNKFRSSRTRAARSVGL